MTKRLIDTATLRAIRAWTRRNSGTWSESDEQELQAWLAMDAQNRAARDRVARLWAAAGDLEGRVTFAAGAERRPYARRALAGLAAAAIAAASIVPIWRLGTNWWNGSSIVLRSGPGSPKAFVLRDGTAVLLDADSELVVQLGVRVRRASLRRGEALFTVVHDTGRPFEVDVGSGRIRDLGTRFDVEDLDGAARIAVLEGRVGIATPRGQMSLAAGRSGGYAADGTLLPVKPVDKSVGLWEHGQRHFDAEPFADVVARLARYHAVDVVLADPGLAQLRVSGTFRMDDLPLFLRTLSMALPIEANWITPQRVEITERRFSGTASQPGAAGARLDPGAR